MANGNGDGAATQDQDLLSSDDAAPGIGMRYAPGDVPVRPGEGPGQTAFVGPQQQSAIPTFEEPGQATTPYAQQGGRYQQPPLTRTPMSDATMGQPTPPHGVGALLRSILGGGLGAMQYSVPAAMSQSVNPSVRAFGAGMAASSPYAMQTRQLAARRELTASQMDSVKLHQAQLMDLITWHNYQHLDDAQQQATLSRYYESGNVLLTGKNSQGQPLVSDLHRVEDSEGHQGMNDALNLRKELQRQMTKEEYQQGYRYRVFADSDDPSGATFSVGKINIRDTVVTPDGRKVSVADYELSSASDRQKAAQEAIKEDHQELLSYRRMPESTLEQARTKRDRALEFQDSDSPVHQGGIPWQDEVSRLNNRPFPMPGEENRAIYQGSNPAWRGREMQRYERVDGTTEWRDVLSGKPAPADMTQAPGAGRGPAPPAPRGGRKAAPSGDEVEDYKHEHNISELEEEAPERQLMSPTGKYPILGTVASIGDMEGMFPARAAQAPPAQTVGQMKRQQQAATQARAAGTAGRAEEKTLTRPVTVVDMNGHPHIMSYDEAQRGIRLGVLKRGSIMDANEAEYKEARDKQARAYAYEGSLNRYQQSINDFYGGSSKGITERDRQYLGALTAHATDKLASDPSALNGLVDAAVGAIPEIGALYKMWQTKTDRDMIEALSPAAKKAMENYYVAIISNFANMKDILGGIGRNESLIRAEINTIPPPYVDRDYINGALNSKRAELKDRNAGLIRVDTQPYPRFEPYQQANGQGRTGGMWPSHAPGQGGLSNAAQQLIQKYSQ